MSTAVKGRSFEYEIKELLRNAGFSVTRAASSKGYADLFGQAKVDLIATRTTKLTQYRAYLTIVTAQCKVKAR